VANLFEEGQAVFARAAGELAGLSGREAEGLRQSEEARCHLLARAAEFGEWRGDGEQALATATQVIELAGRLDLPRYRADAFRTLAILERERGRPEQAIGHLQEAIAIYRSLGVKRQQAMACDWCGLISSDLRRVDQAMDYLKQAAAIYAETGNERGILFNKGMTAVVLSVEGRLAESLAYQREVLAGYQKLDYQLGLGRTCNNLGLVLLELGQFEEAVAQLERAVQLFQRAGNMAGIHNSTGNKGEVHLALDEYDEARRCFEVAGRYFRQMGMRWLDGENQWRLGWLLSNMGEYDEARAALNGCLALAPEDENPEAFAIAHSLLAVIEWQTGDPEQAQAHFDLATEAFKAVRRQLTVARFAIIPRARLLLELGRAAAAETALAEVWPLLGEAGCNPVVCESRLLQARISAARGDPAGAQQQLEQLLAGELRPAEEAAARYELWLLTGDEALGRAALALYRPLAGRSPNLIYHQRVAALGEGPAGDS
jgi:tetratricopeptide (TPR) repeat protein